MTTNVIKPTGFLDIWWTSPIYLVRARLKIYKYAAIYLQLSRESLQQEAGRTEHDR